MSISPTDAKDDHTAKIIQRIKTLTEAIRPTWFGYLGLLAFVGVTLFGLTDADFFALDRNTELPLIGVSVPVTFFFGGAALILSVVYVYLHVYLEQLWYSLGQAPAEIDGRPLSEVVHPWMGSETALNLRRWLRRKTDEPECVHRSPLGWVGVLSTGLLLQGAGPAMVGWLWLWSMPAHLAWMTVGIGVFFWATLWTMWASLASMRNKLGPGDTKAVPEDPAPMREGNTPSPARTGLMSIALLAIVATSLLRTVWDFSGEGTGEVVIVPAAPGYDPWIWDDVRAFFRPVGARVANERLSEFPDDWAHRDHAVNLFYADWCRRPDTPSCASSRPNSRDFLNEWRAYRTNYIAALRKPDLSGRDLAGADFSNAFMPGIDFEGANLRRAEFPRATMEEAVLDEADLRNAWFGDANLIHVEVWNAMADEADFGGADLRNAEFSSTRLQRASFEGARLTNSRILGTDLREARLGGADLSGSRIRHTNFFEAILVPEDLHATSVGDIPRVNLKYARIERSWLSGGKEFPLVLVLADLQNTAFPGTAFRNALFEVDADGDGTVDLSAGIDADTDVSTSFGDGSVVLPEGIARPCQWAGEAEILDDAEYYGRWLGWLNAEDPNVFPSLVEFGIDDVEPIPPPEGCAWPN